MKKLLLTSAMVLSVASFSFAGEVKKSSDIPENQIICLENLLDEVTIGPDPVQTAKNTIVGAYLSQGYPPCEVLDIYKRMMKHWEFWDWSKKRR